jgi:hypothetical protein
MITARDAREETAVGADHIHSIAAPAIPELKLKALNPAADEFTASRSTSQATSEVSAGRRSEGDDDSMGSPAPSPHAEFGREPTFSRGNRPSGGPNGRSAPPGYGWESPQVRDARWYHQHQVPRGIFHECSDKSIHYCRIVYCLRICRYKQRSLLSGCTFPPTPPPYPSRCRVCSLPTPLLSPACPPSKLPRARACLLIHLHLHSEAMVAPPPLQALI